MPEKIKALFKGKRKFITLPAIPIAAILAWPFLIPGLLGFLVHKKVKSSSWKYGLLTLLTLWGIGSAPAYYNTLTHSYVAQSNQTETRTIGSEVQSAIAPTATPVPSPTTIPTKILLPTVIPTKLLFPTQVYIAPTREFIPPTSAPAAQTNSTLDNNNYYTNSAGNVVHSPANTVDGSVPAGATARCGDGTYSFSQSHRGTCSHHSGVAEWL